MHLKHTLKPSNMFQQPRDIINLIADYGVWADVCAMSTQTPMDAYIARRFPDICEHGGLWYLDVLFNENSPQYHNIACETCCAPDPHGVFETTGVCLACTNGSIVLCAMCGSGHQVVHISQYAAHVVGRTSTGIYSISPTHLNSAEYRRAHPGVARMLDWYLTQTVPLCATCSHGEPNYRKLFDSDPDGANISTYVLKYRILSETDIYCMNYPIMYWGCSVGVRDRTFSIREIVGSVPTLLMYGLPPAHNNTEQSGSVYNITLDHYCTELLEYQNEINHYLGPSTPDNNCVTLCRCANIH